MMVNPSHLFAEPKILQTGFIFRIILNKDNTGSKEFVKDFFFDTNNEENEE